jgi:DNA-directed RNA polymerase subunit RPC12/RpoP
MEDIVRFYQCESCQASYRISHSLAGQSYEVNQCPFCGSNDFYTDSVEELVEYHDEEE